MTDVYLEHGKKRVFAVAAHWPGWARSDMTAEEALDSLAAYTDRYRLAMSPAGVVFEPDPTFDVVEQAKGDATTDFGVPGQHFAGDLGALSGAGLDRQIEVWEACWHALDGQALVSPEELRKGPRGGGRDKSKMIAHVVEADRTYARKIGVRIPPLDPHDRMAVARLRKAMVDGATAENERHPEGYNTIPDKAWTVRYLIRRSAWHALDHAWEMGDRSE